VTTRTRRLLRLFHIGRCGATALAAIVVAGAIDPSAAFASVAEPTKPSEASDNVSARNFFICPPPKMYLVEFSPAPSSSPAGELDLLSKTPIIIEQLHLHIKFFFGNAINTPNHAKTAQKQRYR
jgi:hypothetical protein